MRNDLRQQTIDRYTEQLDAVDASLSGVFLEAAQLISPRLDKVEFEDWARSGMQLFHGTWNSTCLARSFYRETAHLVDLVSPQAFGRLIELPAILAEISINLATAFLKQAPNIFATLHKAYHKEFLDFAIIISEHDKADIWNYLEQGPELMIGFNPDQSVELMALLSEMIESGEQSAFALFTDISRILKRLDEKESSDLIRITKKLVVIDPLAAVEFIKSSQEVHARAPHLDMEQWLELGLKASQSPLASTVESTSLQSFFKLESRRAESLLDSLSGRVCFRQIDKVLRLYGQALGGQAVQVEPWSKPGNNVTGWVSGQGNAGEGATIARITVPPFVETFTDNESNIQVYKLCIAHQTSRIFAGSFDYKYGEDGRYLKSSVVRREQGLSGSVQTRHPKTEPFVPLQGFFNLFEDRYLIETLFALVDDTRIDALVAAEYGGLKAWMGRIKNKESENRPRLLSLGLRQAFIENLLRASLDDIVSIHWPQDMLLVLAASLGALRVVKKDQAGIQDSAETAALLYDVAVMIPNVPVSNIKMDWVQIDESDIPNKLIMPPDLSSLSMIDTEKLREIPFDAPASPEFRGDFKPELVQALTSLKSKKVIDDISIERLRELLEQSVEIRGEITAESILEQLEVRVETSNDLKSENEKQDGTDPESLRSGGDKQDIKWFNYDEWDFRALDYLNGWCRVGESRLQQGKPDYYDAVLKQHHHLVMEIRHQFELMKPASRRRLKFLDDGNEIDLDQAISFLVDKRAGAGPRARFYCQTDKTERDIAIAFLIDMSGSTDSPIGESDDEANLQRRMPGGGDDIRKTQKRIVDLEKESIVLMTQALEVIGDAYSIYGFSGDGKNRVSFHVIKEWNEPIDDSVKRCIHSIAPLHATRMGAAIRHACSKLAAVPAKVKILMLISDGQPQDQDYGRDARDREYAIHDTKQALIEAKRCGVTPFLITLDSNEREYLGEMCGDMGYEVVPDIESLPARLPSIYRYLTAMN